MAVAATGVEERLLIGGEWVEAGDGSRFDVTDPGTGETVGSVPNAGESDVRAAIDAAAGAFDDWKAQPALNRARILRDLLAANEMVVGRYYLRHSNFLAAITRFRTVVTTCIEPMFLIPERFTSAGIHRPTSTSTESHSLESTPPVISSRRPLTT